MFEFDDMFVLWLAFDMVPDEFVVAVVLDVVVVVLVVADEFAVVAVFVVLFVLVDVLLAVSPPQAIPRAVKPKRADSAIIFFIGNRSPVFLKD